MSSTQSTAAKDSNARRQLIGGAIVVVCLLIGGGIVYWYMFGSGPKRRTVAVDPNDQVDVARGRMTYVRRPPPPITQTGPGTWQVAGATGGMTVTQDAGGGYSFVYFFTGVKPPADQVAIIAAGLRMQQDAAMAKEWGVTPEQIAKIKPFIKTGSLLNPAPQDRAAIAQLWTAYIAAGDKAEAQKKIIDKLEEVSKSAVEPAKKVYADRAEQVKKILTAEQLEKITKR